jgi:hypothetical protein
MSKLCIKTEVYSVVVMFGAVRVDRRKAPVEDEGGKDTDEEVYMAIGGLFMVAPTIQTVKVGLSIVAVLQYMLAMSWMALALLEADRTRKIKVSVVLIALLGIWVMVTGLL